MPRILRLFYPGNDPFPRGDWSDAPLFGGQSLDNGEGKQTALSAGVFEPEA